MLKQVIIKQTPHSERFEWMIFDIGGDPGLAQISAGSIEALESELGPGVEATACYVASPLAVAVNEISLSDEERKYASKTVPFLLEDQLINDVEHLHFALNKQRDAVAITESSLLSEQLQRFQSDVLTIEQCVPAVLTLPYEMDCWSLHYDGQNCLVRNSEKSGFAIYKGLITLALEALVREKGAPASGIKAFVESDELRQELLALIPEGLSEKTEVEVQPLLALASRNHKSIKLNLMQGQFAPTTQWLKLWGRWRVAVSAFFALLFLQTIVVYAENFQLDSKSLAMRQSIEKVYRDVFPRGVVVDPEEQMRRQLQSLRKSNSSASFVAYYGQLGKVLNRYQNITLSALNYDTKSAEIRLNLTVADYQTVEKLRADFAAAGLKADLLNSNAQDDGVQARLRIKQTAGAQ